MNTSFGPATALAYHPVRRASYTTGCKLSQTITLGDGHSFILTGVQAASADNLLELQAPNGDPACSEYNSDNGIDVCVSTTRFTDIA